MLLVIASFLSWLLPLSAASAQDASELPGAEIIAQEEDGLSETPPATGEGDAATPTVKLVQLQMLNKVTTRREVLEAPVGTLMRFGNLEVAALACQTSAPEELPENKALLEVWELKPGESPQRIFRGWMFSSSPSLSALSHPVYDLVVLRCQEKPMDAPVE